MSSKDLLALFERLGLDAKNQLSVVEPKVADLLRAQLKGAKAASAKASDAPAAVATKPAAPAAARNGNAAAAPPAAAMMTSNPRAAAEEAHSNKRSGVRCAEMTWISCGICNSASCRAACCIVSQSDWLPMMTPTSG